MTRHLQGHSNDLGGVYDARLNHVDILFFLRIEAEITRLLEHFAYYDRPFNAGVFYIVRGRGDHAFAFFRIAGLPAGGRAGRVGDSTMHGPPRRQGRAPVWQRKDQCVAERKNGADRQLVLLWRGCRQNPGTGSLANPLLSRSIRSAARLAVVISCALIVFGPWFISEAVAATVMLSVGWLAVTGLVMGIPVLVWSLAEEAVRFVRVRLRPPIPTPRGVAARAPHPGPPRLRRSRSVDAAPDEALLLLSNMDTRGLRETRRAIALWKYRRWQEKGFPAR